MKHIIIGAGLGGLITGILLKKAKPGDEVVIYDGNKIPGGFCTAFEKVTTYENEKIKYTINIPLLTSDFAEGDPFDLFLEYLGVKNIKWNIVNNLFQFYPLDEKPILFTKSRGIEDLLERADEDEKKKIIKFFDEMKVFYNDIFHRAYVNSTPKQAIELLFKIPKSIMTMINDKPYLDSLNDIGIKNQSIKDLLCAAEAFLGVDVDKVSSVLEKLMLQSFLENNAVQPAEGNTFQTLSDNIAERFLELGGKINYNTSVDSISFAGKKADGVIINGGKIPSDYVIISTGQDRILDLIRSGGSIPQVKSLVKKIKKIPFSNSDFYSYYLVDRKFVEENPRFIDIAYHVYKLPKGLDRCNWKLAMSIPRQMYNDKYYVMWIVMVEQDQKKIDEWMDLRKKDYKKYTEEKERMAEMFLKELQEVEPVFKKHPPLKHIITFSPASYLPYGSKYPICGLAQVPENVGAKRMSPVVLDNLFISSGSNFSGGMWGAIAGAWQGFAAIYEKVYGIQVGNHDVLYKPELKNLP
jgi:phytoene dehydrogenase-like protein